VIVTFENAHLPAQACRAAICIASSDGSQSDTANKTIYVEHNYISADAFGITVVKTHAEFSVDHVDVHDNVVRRADQAVAWAVDNQNLSSFHFDGNHYSQGEQFGFSQAVRSWTDWRQYGADPHGDLRADAYGAPKTAGIVGASST
jgi:hypothetical protein